MNNEKKFIYVFSKKDAELLREFGYTLLRQDDTQDVYIFLAENRTRRSFTLDGDIEYCMSDTLMF